MPTVLTNPPRKQSFLKMLYKPEEFKSTGFVCLVWKKNIFKTELFQNDGVPIILCDFSPLFSVKTTELWKFIPRASSR